MSTRQPKKKDKKNKKKINKKNIGLILLYLRAIKVFKILFNILILILIIQLIIALYKNNIMRKFEDKLSLTYSKIVYKNICVNVEINGIEKANINDVQNTVYNFCNKENKNDMIILLEQIKTDPWIKNVTIKRKLPNTLEIKIEEYLPFAIWKNGEKLFLIDENGTIIKINEKERRGYNNLIIVAGEGSKENIYSLFNMLSSNPNLFSRIKSALRVGQRRWNLELENGIIIKMPEKNTLDAWQKLDKILSIRGSDIDIKTIDLRNDDKVFIEEKSSTSN